MKNEQNNKGDHLLSPTEKQVTPLSNEVSHEEAFIKARQSALRYANEVKCKPFRK